MTKLWNISDGISLKWLLCEYLSSVKACVHILLLDWSCVINVLRW